METITFSSLPAEMHVSIAQYCENNDLVNLCRTSKLVKERCSWILYRHVDLLQLDRQGEGKRCVEEYKRMSDASTRTKQFIHALLSHPEYGKHVRSFKGMLGIFKLLKPGWVEDTRSDGLWRAMQSLTHVQSVDLGTRNAYSDRLEVPREQFPTRLFQSATSVRLVGRMEYGLARSILSAINPATLEHLCLDMGQETKFEGMPEDGGEDRRVIWRGAISGLLAPLTGRCIALRTLILRREQKGTSGIGRSRAAEEASYAEWASFICSVQGTVEKFTFEHSGHSTYDVEYVNQRIIREFIGTKFQRHILPAILSGNWPCLTIMTLLGVMIWNHDIDNPITLIGKLRLAFSENVRIVVAKRSRFLPDLWEPYGELE